MIKKTVMFIIFYIHGFIHDHTMIFDRKMKKKTCTGILVFSYSLIDQSNLKYTEICEKIKCQSPLS